MSDENQTMAMPLDIDLNTIDTSFPLIRNGEVVDFQVVKIEKTTTKPPVNAPMLKIELKSTTPTTSIKGETLQPGLMVFHNVMLAPTGKATPAQVLANIGEFTQGAGISGTLGDFINGGFVAAQGQIVTATVNYVAEGPDKQGVIRKAKNEIGHFLKKRG